MTKRNRFIEHTLLNALSFLKDSLFADEFAAQKGLLQSLDPRIKTVSFLLFILLILLSHNVFFLAALYGTCLVLTYASRIPIRFFLMRTWIFIPIFSFVIAIPALLSIVTPGEALTTFQILGLKLTITHQGLSGAVLFVMRVITSVSFAVLLSITTKHFAVLKVLRIFKIPQIFVMTLGMCYRYIYLFAEIIENTYRAMQSRTGGVIHHKKGQHIVAWNIAYLWSRSLKLTEEVHGAMLSRGYRGEPVILENFKMTAKDWFWLVTIAMLLIILVYYKPFL